MKFCSLLLGLFVFGFCMTITAQVDPPGKRYKPIILNPDYEHNKWGVEPTDIIYHFCAYTTSFDSDDDNNDDGEADLWGIPEWVAFEIKKKGDSNSKYGRPSKWMTDDTLNKKGNAPNDNTYGVPGSGNRGDIRIVKTDYRFVRGHLCPKKTADRLGKNATHNTHTVLNAVPQLQWQNNGVWKDIEKQCNEWADSCGRVWIITGPVFFKNNPSMWIGQAGEVKAAVPDALFKIIIREDDKSETGIKTIAFLIPNILPKALRNPAKFITTINFIEANASLTFLTNLDPDKAKREKSRNEGNTFEQNEEVYEGWW